MRLCRNCGYEFRPSDCFEADAHDSRLGLCTNQKKCRRRASTGKYSGNLERLFPPTMDEMLDFIADRLREDCAVVLDHAVTDEDHLKTIYDRAKRGRLMRSCW
jgi:hypothetical protein